MTKLPPLAQEPNAYILNTDLYPQTVSNSASDNSKFIPNFVNLGFHWDKLKGGRASDNRSRGLSELIAK